MTHEQEFAAARALGAPVERVAREDAGQVLTDRIIEMMMRLSTPSHLSPGAGQVE